MKVNTCGEKILNCCLRLSTRQEQENTILKHNVYHTSGISPDSPGFLVLSGVMSGVWEFYDWGGFF
jgi:hypothetical protein